MFTHLAIFRGEKLDLNALLLPVLTLKYDSSPESIPRVTLPNVAHPIIAPGDTIPHPTAGNSTE